VLNPVLVYLAARFLGLTGEGLFAFVTEDYRHTVGTGPLWFVLALLIFAFVYAGLRIASGRVREHTGTRPFPTSPQILGFVLAIGVVAFIVRLVFPTGWQILGLQLGYFPLYIAFFVFGVWAHGNGWLDQLDRSQTRLWGRRARIATVAFLVAVFAGGGPDLVNGGPHLPARWPTRCGALSSAWPSASGSGAVPPGGSRGRRERWRTGWRAAPLPPHHPSVPGHQRHRIVGRRSIRCSASSSSACSPSGRRGRSRSRNVVQRPWAGASSDQPGRRRRQI
jgi:hypothetical protein